MYEHEVELLSQLNHPHTLGIIDHFEIDKFYCIVTELCKYNLTMYLDKIKKDNKHLDQKEISKIAVQLALGLH